MGTFEKVDSRKNIDYLKEEDLVNQLPCTRVCYVANQWAKFSKLDTGFFTLLVKTCDGISVPARIFDLKDFINQGIDVAALVGKFIQIKCKPSIWEGSYSIIIEKVFLIDQDEVTERDKFLGRVNNADSLILQCEKVFQNLKCSSLPTVYKFNSYKSIYSGEVGGYAKFVWTWVFKCMVHASELGEDFLTVLYSSIIHYGNFLDRINSEDVEKVSDKIEVLKCIQTSESRTNQIVSDCVQAILGLGKPEHLYANIIYDEFRSTLRHSRMFSEWGRIVVGGASSSSKEYVLRKY